MSKPAAVELDLAIGSALQLQSAVGGPTRYQVRLIGLCPGRSLLVTAPEQEGRPVAFMQDEPLVARTFVGTNAVGFKTSLLKYATQPYRYLHLTYPTEVQNVQVRGAPRLALRLPVRLFPTGGGELQGALGDLGSRGAMVEIEGEALRPGQTLRLCFVLDFPDLDAQTLELTAVIRNADHPEPGTTRRRYGLEFQAVPTLAALALRAYLGGYLAGLPSAHQDGAS
ncbi:MAG: flagellar brake protein [Nevskiaceae bacterium]|nr:MAG: flagellar brake protein [Nevskiaceae bacterium]TAM23240.1 MAG: flagellar brake protein [Nevskiaceae bacterium]